jgi:hypothetical protein
MKKIIKYLAILSLFTSCKDEKENLSTLSFLNEERTYYLNNNDSVFVNPYQFFSIVEFKEIEFGMNESLVFTVIDSIQECRILNSKRSLKNAHEQLTFSFENFKMLDESNTLEIILDTREGELIRTIEKDKKYKVLYFYRIDPTVYRNNLGTDDFIEGMEIIDIVSVEEDFKKDKTY